MCRPEQRWFLMLSASIRPTSPAERCSVRRRFSSAYTVLRRGKSVKSKVYRSLLFTRSSRREVNGRDGASEVRSLSSASDQRRNLIKGPRHSPKLSTRSEESDSRPLTAVIVLSASSSTSSRVHLASTRSSRSNRLLFALNRISPSISSMPSKLEILLWSALSSRRCTRHDSSSVGQLDPSQCFLRQPRHQRAECGEQLTRDAVELIPRNVEVLEVS